MTKYVFNRKLPKASLIRVRKIAHARSSRFFLKMRGANFLQLYVGPFDICIRMPWLVGPAKSLHPELFRGAK